MTETFDIAIIGGGFSGCLLVANLIKKTRHKLKIVLIEKTLLPGRGIAYGTQDAFHLLNVQAQHMGAFPEDPKHFYQWLEDHQASWRHLDPTFTDLTLDPTGYVPRHLYGFYLSNILKEAIEEGEEKDVEVQLLHDEAIDIERTLCDTLMIALAKGEKIETHAVILALGIPTAKRLSPQEFPGYTADIWARSKDNLLQMHSLVNLPANYSSAIIGSGLTMLDVLASLIERGYPGKVTVISKEGLLPEIHQTHPEIAFKAFNVETAPTTALGLFKALRQATKLAAQEGVDWRSVLDGFRPLANPIWLKLPLVERQKVLKWLLKTWNRHRHRMPGILSVMALSLVEEGRLDLKAGKVIAVEPRGAQVAVKYISQGETRLEILMADHVFNCSGPELNLEKIKTPLMDNLLRRNFLQSNPLGVGVVATPEGDIKGSLEGRLYIMGSLLFGVLFETIAVPELREQCATIADKVLADQVSERFSKDKIGV